MSRIAVVWIVGMMLVPLALRGVQWDKPRRFPGLLAGYLIGFILGVAAGQWLP